jgi:hypothetical protein
MSKHWEEITLPATMHDLITLDECKLMLGIAVGDTSQDAQLQMMITQNSLLIAELCNRGPRGDNHTFGKETLIETITDIGEDQSVWLSHYPIDPGDIITIDANGVAITEYKLDPRTGKLGLVNGGAWAEPVVVEYSGGFNLPDEAPPPLKQICAAFMREERTKNQQAAVAGIRRVAHRDASVQFFDPNAVTIAQSKGGGGSPALQAAQKLLMKYTRIEA